VLFEGMRILSREYVVYAIAAILTFLSGYAIYRRGFMKIYREGLVL